MLEQIARIHDVEPERGLEPLRKLLTETLPVSEVRAELRELSLDSALSEEAAVLESPRPPSLATRV